MRSSVSVIVPVYNGERFIAQAVESVRAQIYADWELIVVNDGSTDGTAEIVGHYRDSRIRIIHQENRGLAGARNTGIRAANGEYLAFLDADDAWMPCFLQRCVAVLERESTLGGVYALNYHMDENGDTLPQLGGQIVAPERLWSRLLQGGFFPPCAVVARASVVREVGLFDTDLQGQGTEDWDLWLRLTHRHPMRGIPEPLVHYRVYSGSMSTHAAKMHACRISTLTKRFGPPAGESSDWAAEKRQAYAFAYRAAALSYIAQHDDDPGWRCLMQAVEIEPSLLNRLSTFYELALGDQPRGVRGDATRLNIAVNGTEMLRRMDELFAAAGPEVRALRGPAYGNAYLALAMLSDQAGQWGSARRYMLHALRAHPALAHQRGVARRFAKLLAGKRVVGWLRALRPGTDHLPFEESEA